MKNLSAQKKDIARKGYSFLTKKGFRVDAKGKTPKEAYEVARSVGRHHEKSLSRFKDKENSYYKATKGDKLSGTYFQYNKDGLHAVEGRYSQFRPSRFRKGDKHS